MSLGNRLGDRLNLGVRSLLLEAASSWTGLRIGSGAFGRTLMVAPLPTIPNNVGNSFRNEV